MSNNYTLITDGVYRRPCQISISGDAVEDLLILVRYANPSAQDLIARFRTQAEAALKGEENDLHELSPQTLHDIISGKYNKGLSAEASSEGIMFSQHLQLKRALIPSTQVDSFVSAAAPSQAYNTVADHPSFMAIRLGQYQRIVIGLRDWILFPREEMEHLLNCHVTRSEPLGILQVSPHLQTYHQDDVDTILYIYDLLGSSGDTRQFVDITSTMIDRSLALAVHQLKIVEKISAMRSTVSQSPPSSRRSVDETKLTTGVDPNDPFGAN